MRRFGISALVIGMVAAIAGSAVVAIAPGEVGVRTLMVRVALLLMAVGYAAVASTLTGWPRVVLRLVAGLSLAWLGWVIARPFLPELEDWHHRVVAATLWWSGIVALTIAARAWWRPTPVLVIAAVLAVTAEALPWAPYLAPAFDTLVVDTPLEPWIRPLRELVTSGAILVLVSAVARDASAAPSDGRSGSSGSRRPAA